ncbi:unnamed protein product [Paramecium sonneborni]|uniref:Uncharacterized protein n=1 Tax=Paramecium sonneborni TaxID=65129 RepID=A0A8S1KZH2_9CILI|nr:unnamed protein product [Paramecium sonneborni]
MRGFVKQFMFTEQVSLSSQQQIKRCYKEARIEMATNPINPFHQWIIKLDGKSIKTQKRNILAVPSPQLAAYIAQEFNNQNQNMQFFSMPFLKFASHAVDLDFDASNRQMLEMKFMFNLENDLIMRGQLNSDKLPKTETQIADSLLIKLSRKLNIQINSNDDRYQEYLNQQSKIKLESFIRGINNWQLVALNSKIENLSSCILGLYLQLGLINISSALALRKSLIEFRDLNRRSSQKENNEQILKTTLEASQMFSESITTQSIMY